MTTPSSRTHTINPLAPTGLSLSSTRRRISRALRPSRRCSSHWALPKWPSTGTSSAGSIARGHQLRGQCRAPLPGGGVCPGPWSERVRHGVSGERCRPRPAVRHRPGAKPFVGKIGPMELNIPAIYGIGESTLSFVDRYGERAPSMTWTLSSTPTGRPAWPRWTRGSMRSTT